VGSFIYVGGPGELLGARVIPALAPQVARGAHLRVRLGQTGPLLDALTKAELDLVVATVRQPKRGLEFEPLYEEEFVLVAGTTWAERICRRETSVDANLLADVPLVSYHIDLPILRRYWRVVFGEHLRRDASLVVDDLRGVLAAVVAGAGISVLPSYLCMDELARGKLVQLLNPDVPPRNTIFLTCRTGSLSRASLAALHEELLQVAKSW
jgi:DNA-binding transcriptional LysR family regulator